MLAIAEARCSPKARADGSFQEAPSAAAPGAGDGVAGTCEVVEGADCDGAGGTDGVDAGFAGVDGSAGFEGGALGCGWKRVISMCPECTASQRIRVEYDAQRSAVWRRV